MLLLILLIDRIWKNIFSTPVGFTRTVNVCWNGTFIRKLLSIGTVTAYSNPLEPLAVATLTASKIDRSIHICSEYWLIMLGNAIAGKCLAWLSPLLMAYLSSKVTTDWTPINLGELSVVSLGNKVTPRVTCRVGPLCQIRPIFSDCVARKGAPEALFT